MNQSSKQQGAREQLGKEICDQNGRQLKEET